ncbi:MAG: DUF1549 domain-containing protein [Planctomycetales bacterium]
MRGISHFSQAGRFSRAKACLVLMVVVSLALPPWQSTHAAHKPSDPAKSTPKKVSEIAPRHPRIPAARPGATLTNPIDLLLQPYFEQHKFTPPAVVSDRVYARRVYLDLIGLLPTPAQLAAFEADQSPDKREKLVDQILADNEAYAIHWLSFWNDALRNDYRGTGYIDGGRKSITGWLYNALLKNVPYDQFVRELVSPVPESEGFVKGIVWRGVVNASQVPPVQAAQNIGQVFMGINLKCASCHDSFISSWKLTDAYGLAGVFSEQPLEIHHCDAPTKKFATQKFLYKELGEIDEKASRAERMKQLAAIITNPQNGQLTRTMVNRLWARFLGHGIIDPVDEMEDDPWNQDLLDWLAADLSDHRYDLKHTMKQIVTSRAYQLPSVGVDEQATAYVFRGPSVKRLSSEQFMDALAQVAGPWDVTDASNLKYPTLPPKRKTQTGPAIRVDSSLAAGGKPAPHRPHDRRSAATRPRTNEPGAGGHQPAAGGHHARSSRTHQWGGTRQTTRPRRRPLAGTLQKRTLRPDPAVVSVLPGTPADLGRGAHGGAARRFPPAETGDRRPPLGARHAPRISVDFVILFP